MSLEYCDKCDKMIDLDHDEHWEHFKDKWEDNSQQGSDKEVGSSRILSGNKKSVYADNPTDTSSLNDKQMKGGKKDEKEMDNRS